MAGKTCNGLIHVTACALPYLSACLQGLLGRPDWPSAAALPMCPVPTGSGNGMAASCGLWDPSTTAVAVCRGRVQPCDVVSALQPPGQRYYCLLSLVYGLMANLDVGTEHLRWARRGGGCHVCSAPTATVAFIARLARVHPHPHPLTLGGWMGGWVRVRVGPLPDGADCVSTMLKRPVPKHMHTFWGSCLA